jgi:hypothetical protein
MTRGLIASVVVLAALLALSAGHVDAQNQASQISNVRNNGYRSAAIAASANPIIPTSAIFNGSAAACSITMQLNGDTAAATWSNVQPGEILPVQALIVSSTTCTGLIALYDR